MSVLSHLHQLFCADTCQAYLHTLRWQDRPLHCPRCQGHDVCPWGNYHYRPGLKRYWCHGCRRTFNDLTHTLFAQSKRSLSYWILATFLLCPPVRPDALPGSRCPYPDQLSVVLVAAPCGPVLREAAPGGGHGRSR